VSRAHLLSLAMDAALVQYRRLQEEVERERRALYGA